MGRGTNGIFMVYSTCLSLKERILCIRSIPIVVFLHTCQICGFHERAVPPGIFGRRLDRRQRGAEAQYKAVLHAQEGGGGGFFLTPRGTGPALEIAGVVIAIIKTGKDAQTVSLMRTCEI